MQILNLVNIDRSDIKYSISRFPDGEVQINLEEFSRKDRVNVRCRITSAEDLLILMQVSDILVRHGVYFSISIYYLMGMRMDRVMDFNRPFTLKVIVNILDNLGASKIEIFEPHSYRTFELFKKTKVDRLKTLETDAWYSTWNFLWDEYQIVLPDEGASNRYFPRGIVPPGIIVGEKKRDSSTGKILSIDIKNPQEIGDRPLVVFDDLCDGGGTFIGLAEAIRRIKPDAKIHIIVNHMVNPKGIENLSKNFGQVYITNSYKEWKGLKAEYGKIVPTLPDNVSQIDII